VCDTHETCQVASAGIENTGEGSFVVGVGKMWILVVLLNFLSLVEGTNVLGGFRNSCAAATALTKVPWRAAHSSLTLAKHELRGAEPNCSKVSEYSRAAMRELSLGTVVNAVKVIASSECEEAKNLERQLQTWIADANAVQVAITALEEVCDAATQRSVFSVLADCTHLPFPAIAPFVACACKEQNVSLTT
jgi:hypothetical protein